MSRKQEGEKGKRGKRGNIQLFALSQPLSKIIRDWGLFCLAALLIWGCGGRPDPFGQQVTRATNLSIQGQQWLSQGDLKRAARAFGRALELSRAIDYPPGEVQQLNNLGAVALEKGNLETARDLFKQSLIICQDLQNWSEASTILANLATVDQKAGNFPQAEQHLQAARDAAQHSGSKEALGLVLCQMGGFYLSQQDQEAAAEVLKQAQPLATTPALQGALNHHLGRLYLRQGDIDAALKHFNQALAADREILDRAAMAADLFGLAETYQARGDLAQAFDYYRRSFDVYAALKKRTRLQECAARLRQVNNTGHLGRSLKRFEPYLKLKPTS